MKWTTNSTMIDQSGEGLDLKIRKGDKFVCTSDVVMNGNPEDVAYTTGKIYTSELDGCITNNEGIERHKWYGNWIDHFQRYEDCCGRCNGVNDICITDRPDKDYFQSMQEEYGKKGDNEAFDNSVKIMETSASLTNLLLYKNNLYGNSGLEPIKVLSKVDSTTGLLQRADDKIARIKNSPELRKNDVADLMGYLVLICVSKGWTNFKVTYWFVSYYFARMIRPFFHLDKPKITVSEFVNNPRRSLIEIVLV